MIIMTMTTIIFIVVTAHTMIIILMKIIFIVDVGEEHTRTAFLSNRHSGSIAKTARSRCEAPSGLSRTHIFAFKFLLSSEQGIHTHLHFTISPNVL